MRKLSAFALALVAGFVGLGQTAFAQLAPPDAATVSSAIDSMGTQVNSFVVYVLGIAGLLIFAWVCKKAMSIVSRATSGKG